MECNLAEAEQHRSAMSMLTFYINRSGKTLPASRKRTLERAKEELRKRSDGGDALRRQVMSLRGS
jgi:hypothetical protein